ncbi:MAG: hypothetical protein Q7J67_01695 [bacterium]|nr:hypothetical protein [bacterium]
MNLDLRPLELKPIRLSDIPDTLPTPGFVPDKPTPSFIPDKPTSGFVPDEVIPEWSKVTAGILWLIIGFISVWTIYGFIRWCIINLTTWIIIGFKTSQ